MNKAAAKRCEKCGERYPPVPKKKAIESNLVKSEVSLCMCNPKCENICLHPELYGNEGVPDLKSLSEIKDGTEGEQPLSGDAK